MVKMKERGFTLIELLVVIAIIGLLAAVVLASLGTARQKGADAAVKSDIDGLRAQAELSASNNNNSYTNVCTDTTVVSQMNNAANSSGATVLAANTSQTSGTVACFDSATAWAVSAPLSSGGYWCADSTGVASSTASLLTVTSCP